MSQSLIGIPLVCLASLFVAVGSYLISSFYYNLNSLNFHDALFSERGFALAGGYAFNLAGSIFWILGRRAMTTYLFSWNLYMGLLVIFGACIATLVDGKMLTASQYFGIATMIVALGLLRK